MINNRSLKLKKLFFAITPEKNILNETFMTLLRVAAGLLMAGLHGSGKVPPSEQLISGVGAMGFPAPVAFAWLAGLAELAGGIFLAVGFLTRPSAFLIAFTMFVAAFGAHLADPWNMKELSVLYLCISLVFVFKGAGNFSIDRFIK